MRRPRSGPSSTFNGRRKNASVPARRAQNAFRIDREDVPAETADMDESMNQSDEEGVKSEDDEEIDSDEAFGESDEEKYSSFKFLGSSVKDKKGKGKAGSSRPIEDEDEDADEDNEEDDDMYMDLSEMLSNGHSANESSKKTLGGATSEDSGDDTSEESEDEFILAESDSEQDEDQLDQLGAFVDSLSSKIKPTEPEQTKPEPELMQTPETSNELAMSDILASLTDPSLQSFRKSLAVQQSSKSKSIGQKLDVPLARPIKERLERQAAYEETKNEVSKWQPIVKANREADHLRFPMNEPEKQTKQTSASLAGTFEPTTSLEKRVDELLRQSGIRSEKEITTFEDLALKKVSIDEVRTRQAQLRAMRELMFRQDQKAKRIAKIKSKAYHKVLKRERERRRLIDGDEEEDEREKVLKAEAARAKERMTLRHKNTGEWAKKVLARGQHDLETRQAISDQIRRGDDLQRRIMGNDQESEDESDSAEELEELIRDPNKWGEENVVETASEVRKGVMGMKFMRDAEERQKRENAQQIADMRAMLDGGSDQDEIDEDTTSTQQIHLGRKIFTPGDRTDQSKEPRAGNRRQENATEEEEEIVVKIVKNPFHMNETSQKPGKKSTSRMAIQENADSTSSEPPANAWPSTNSPTAASEPKGNQSVENAWLVAPKSSKQTSDNRINKIQNKRKRDDEDNAQVHIDVSLDAINQKLAAAAGEAEEDEEQPSMTHGRGKIAFKQTELINRAFAADGFEEEFAAEKQAAIEEDTPKEEDVTLPGWGSWTGQGVKRRATERKWIKKIPGIEESKRKDAKLKNVIINEKRSKATTKYLASGTVPYPFETKEQYERSLSMPVGPEWTTREMYQKMTKPRVTIRAGAVVSPLQAPFK